MITPKSIHRGRGEGIRKKEKHAQVRRRPSLGDLTPPLAFAPTAALEPMPQNLEEAAKLEEDSKNPPKGGKASGLTGSAVGRTGSAVGRTGSAVGRTGSTVGRTGSVAKPGS